MSALPPKADTTATNSRAAYPLPQQMIKMLTLPNSLLTGKRTGNFSILGHIAA
jgi:hypothetical protein